jgi:hypothetical protein
MKRKWFRPGYRSAAYRSTHPQRSSPQLLCQLGREPKGALNHGVHVASEIRLSRLARVVEDVGAFPSGKAVDNLLRAFSRRERIIRRNARGLTRSIHRIDSDRRSTSDVADALARLLALRCCAGELDNQDSWNAFVSAAEANRTGLDAGVTLPQADRARMPERMTATATRLERTLTPVQRIVHRKVLPNLSLSPCDCRHEPLALFDD